MTKQLTIICDCDGIHTSANLLNTIHGKGKLFSVNDSLTSHFIQEFYKDQIKIIILTGDTGTGLELTKERMEYLNLEVKQCKNIYKYHWIKDHYNIEDIIYIGDDIYDIAIFKECMYACTVCNAPQFIKTNADFTSSYEGGKNGFTDIMFHIIRKFISYDIDKDIIEYVKSKNDEYIKLKNEGHFQ